MAPKMAPLLLDVNGVSWSQTQKRRVNVRECGVEVAPIAEGTHLLNMQV